MNERVKYEVIRRITREQEGLLHFASDRGVCYEHITGTREVFWTDRNKNELVIIYDGGTDEECTIELFFDSSDTVATILGKIQSFI